MYIDITGAHSIWQDIFYDGCRVWSKRFSLFRIISFRLLFLKSSYHSFIYFLSCCPDSWYLSRDTVILTFCFMYTAMKFEIIWLVEKMWSYRNNSHSVPNNVFPYQRSITILLFTIYFHFHIFKNISDSFYVNVKIFHSSLFRTNLS